MPTTSTAHFTAATVQGEHSLGIILRPVPLQRTLLRSGHSARTFYKPLPCCRDVRPHSQQPLAAVP